MTRHAKLISALIALMALRKPRDYLTKPLGFCAVASINAHIAEYLIFGGWIMGPVERIGITTMAAAPFMALVFYVVTYLDRLQLSLGEQAATDPLTGLPNRRAFMKRTQARLDILDEAPRGVILLIDADHFKRVNDNWGHQVGDECLMAMAERMRTVLRTGDMLARIGGEEFAAYLPSTTLEEAVRIGSPLCTPITVIPTEPPGRLRLTLSVGASEVRPEMTLSEAMHLADLALYRAKDEGRARLVPWDGRVRPGEGRAA
ncbi:GGDEF domain-containing protein [Flavimaricola marinus]|uniref:diguanylate cyclase n=1 Tax=Flavimaricola marinus TaxID=1819565 RepID=A0A238LCW3_9RHOB|nr:GGDEF domain-containing protein [Flavimaricola marinus]SMY07393.1 putative diguanylate cyclase YdaM [Flavimaricola marinus]